MNDGLFELILGSLGSMRSCAMISAVILVAVSGLAGCGEGRRHEPDQVVAWVNGDKITVRQVNSELARLGVRDASKNDKTSRRVLNALVDRQLLVQQATGAKLHRDPQVLQAVEHSRRRILSEAFLERSARFSLPGAEEVQRFYTAHPALFQQRRIYSLRDYVMERSELSDDLRGKLAFARTGADVTAALKAANVNYREAYSVRAAEQLPLDMLPKMVTMTKGEVAVLLDDQTAVVMQLIDFSDQPIDFEKAIPYIEQYLVNEQKKQLAENKLRELRASAKIAYMITFQDGQEQRTPVVRLRPSTAAAHDASRTARYFIDKGFQDPRTK